MTTFFAHERHYRDLTPTADRLITICGAGALGANLAETLARMGLRTLRVIDRDRVEAHNLSTQPWQQQDIGAAKTRVLAAMLHRAVGARLDARQTELNETNAEQLIAGSAVIVDAFDNMPSRTTMSQAAKRLGIACLHLALGPDGDYGCGLWDHAYSAGARAEQADTLGRDPCDYPLTRPLALLVAAAGAETLVTFLLTGERRGFEITLRDLRLT